MLALLYLLLCGLVGWSALRRLPAWERLLWSWPLGLILLPTLTFMLALWTGSHTLALALGVGLAVVGIGVGYREPLKALGDLRQCPSDAWALLGSCLPWWGFTAWVGPRLLFVNDVGDLVAGWRIVWADWAVHARSSTFFAAQTQFNLNNPLFAGIEFRYPYISAYLSSLLQRLGLSVAESLVWPTLILLALLPALLLVTGRQLGLNRAAAVLAVYLFLGAGGAGIAEFWADLAQGRWFWQAGPFAPRLYTDMEPWANWPNSRIWFMNFVSAQFLPQRAFLAGIPLALFVLYLWRSRSLRRRWLAGSCLGLLPLVHTHSYIAIGFVTAVVAAADLLQCCEIRSYLERYFGLGPLKSEAAPLRQILRELLSFFVPAVVLGFGLLFGLVFNPSDAGSFVRWIPGWLPDHSQATTPLSFLVFWGRNLGVMLVLALLAYRHLSGYWLAAWLLFITCNLISFQPWHWDNMKLLTYSYLIWAWSVAALLTAAWRWRRLWLVAPLVALSLGAGWLDITSVAIASRQPITLVPAAGIEFAEAVAAATPADAIILTAPTHDHPVSVLSGRPLYMGYPGWLWAYGIDYWEREQTISRFYSEMSDLSDAIRYIAVTPAEQRFNPTPELSALPLVVDLKGYRLYQARE